MKAHLGKKELERILRQDVSLPPSTEARLEQIYDEIRRESRKKESLTMHSKKKNHLKTFIVIAAVVAVLGGTALAAGLTHSDFFEAVFGSGIPGRAEMETVTNPFGSTYELPIVEREDADASKAEAILGGYIAESGKAIEVNGFTVTVQSYVMDKNGIACLTYTLENPDGLDILHDAGTGYVYYYDEQYFDTGARLFEPSFFTTSGAMLDSRTFRDESRLTDTKATLVVYITPFGAVANDDGIVITLYGYSDGDDRKLAAPDLAKLILPASAKAEAREFTGGDFSVWISPVGITITTTLPSIDAVVKDIVINYTDGSKYIVYSDDTTSGPYIYNISVGSQSSQTSWEAFNRLVDADNVASVVINGIELAQK